jgi:hypothetical protein
MKSCAPIAIFCYNRLDKLNNLIDSIKKNEEYSNSKIYFFIDIFEHDPSVTHEIIEYVQKIEGFLEKEVIVRDKSYGLRDNILTGIDYVFKSEEMIICLEDDLIIDKYFLFYMNLCLNHFKDQKNVWHINGWSYPRVTFFSSRIIIGRLINSWGWATWKDRWLLHDERENNLITNLDNSEKKKFNYYNLTNWEQQLKDNDANKIKTWAIFWYQTVFLKNGLSVYPSRSLIFNSGMDGSGTNSGISKIFETALKQKKVYKLPKKIKENKINSLFTILFYIKINFFKRINYWKIKYF